MRRHSCRAAAVLCLLNTPAVAATIVFDTAPFGGSTALTFCREGAKGGGRSSRAA
jgi:hypothetical protein